MRRGGGRRTRRRTVPGGHAGPGRALGGQAQPSVAQEDHCTPAWLGRRCWLRSRHVAQAPASACVMRVSSTDASKAVQQTGRSFGSSWAECSTRAAARDCEPLCFEAPKLVEVYRHCNLLQRTLLHAATAPPLGPAPQPCPLATSQSLGTCGTAMLRRHASQLISRLGLAHGSGWQLQAERGIKASTAKLPVVLLEVRRRAIIEKKARQLPCRTCKWAAASAGTHCRRWQAGGRGEPAGTLWPLYPLSRD